MGVLSRKRRREVKCLTPPSVLSGSFDAAQEFVIARQDDVFNEPPAAGFLLCKGVA
jgi:hypothetical protein